METAALAALKSLDSDACTRSSPDQVLPGSIKLTEETLSRLAHLLKSGCSIQLACDDVKALMILRCALASIIPVARLSIFRLQIGVSRTSFYRWVDRARTEDAPYIYYECVQSMMHRSPCFKSHCAGLLPFLLKREPNAQSSF